MRAEETGQGHCARSLARAATGRGDVEGAHCPRTSSTSAPSFEKSFVNILTSPGGTVTIDGALVEGFVPIGGPDTLLGRFELSKDGDGHHRIETTWHSAINVYGYGQYTSYLFGSPYGAQIIPW